MPRTNSTPFARLSSRLGFPAFYLTRGLSVQGQEKFHPAGPPRDELCAAVPVPPTPTVAPGACSPHMHTHAHTRTQRGRFVRRQAPGRAQGQSRPGRSQPHSLIASDPVTAPFLSTTANIDREHTRYLCLCVDDAASVSSFRGTQGTGTPRTLSTTEHRGMCGVFSHRRRRR